MGTVSTVIEDGVAIVTLSNPNQGLMDDAMEQQLHTVVHELNDDEAASAIIITGGQPDVFVRHYDVSVLVQRGEKLAAKGMVFTPDRPVPRSPIHELLDAMESAPKPYIAAINGHAMGGGFELALACDIRLVQSGEYSLGLPEVNLGILPGAGGTQRLTKLIGASRAMQYMLLGRTMSPSQAVEYGVALSCADGPVLDAAKVIAKQLAAKSPAALAHIKRLVHTQGTTPVADAHALERTLFCDLMVSDNALALMREWDAGIRDIRDQD